MGLDNKTLINKRTSRLSFAVSLEDDFSKSMPIGKINQGLQGLDSTPIVNPSQYYVFLNLPKGDYTILTKSEYYFEDSTHITLVNLPRKDPVNISLKPLPSYPFPQGETLVRGILKDKDLSPLAGAKLSYTVMKDGVAKGSNGTTTTDRGEFVFYFGAIKTEDLTKKDGKYFAEVTIRAEYSGLVENFQLNEIEIGKTRSVNNFIINS